MKQTRARSPQGHEKFMGGSESIIIASYDVARTDVTARLGREDSELSREVPRTSRGPRDTFRYSIVDLAFRSRGLLHLAESFRIDIYESVG
jgi:hypothetical protein